MVDTLLVAVVEVEIQMLLLDLVVQVVVHLEQEIILQLLPQSIQQVVVVEEVDPILEWQMVFQVVVLPVLL
jgi:TPP-dependent indolepyruvate ferredoxin oxidoreductase alpha subunit